MKTLIVQLLMRVTYYCGIDSIFYRFNRYAKRVVTFHNVMPEDREWFRNTIREMAGKFGFSTDVDDAATLTITFDDGYCNQYEIAAEVLREEGGIPAILFGSGKALWSKSPKDALPIDLIGFWSANVPLEFLKKETGLDDRRVARIKVLHARYRADNKARGVNLVRQLDGVYPFDRLFAEFPREWLRLRFTGISAERLDDLRARGWIIGWHTENHFPLSFLSDSDVRQEMTPPDEFKGFPMSYPYGTEREVGRREQAIADEKKFYCAFSNVVPTGSTRFFRRRFSQIDDKYRLHFVLSGVKYFLQHLRLLPRR